MAIVCGPVLDCGAPDWEQSLELSSYSSHSPGTVGTKQTKQSGRTFSDWPSVFLNQTSEQNYKQIHKQSC